jgi:hypothetical protein
MSGLLIAVDGCTLKFQDPTHTGTITIFPSAPTQFSEYVKCSSKRVYTVLYFTVSGGSNGQGITAASGFGTIYGTTQALTVDGGIRPVRKGDSVTFTMTGVQGQTPATYSETVMVDDPGQEKASGS